MPNLFCFDFESAVANESNNDVINTELRSSFATIVNSGAKIAILSTSKNAKEIMDKLKQFRFIKEVAEMRHITVDKLISENMVVMAGQGVAKNQLIANAKKAFESRKIKIDKAILIDQQIVSLSAAAKAMHGTIAIPPEKYLVNPVQGYIRRYINNYLPKTSTKMAPPLPPRDAVLSSQRPPLPRRPVLTPQPIIGKKLGALVRDIPPLPLMKEKMMTSITQEISKLRGQLTKGENLKKEATKVILERLNKLERLKGVLAQIQPDKIEALKHMQKEIDMFLNPKTKVIEKGRPKPSGY